MALINRVARLFAADAHAVIDKLEEPEFLLKQAARDMQAAVHASEEVVRDLAKQRDATSRSIERAEQQLAQAAEELDVCFKADDDELAKTVVRRRLQLERYLDELNKQVQTIAVELEKREAELRDQQLALEELKQKAEVVQVATGSDAPATASVTAQEVEVAFLREKQRRAST